MIDLCELATEHGLEVIRTTSGVNGSSENIKKAIIGFESFSKAEELADKNGLYPICLYKKNDWSLWERKGIAFDAITVSSSDFIEKHYEDGAAEWQPDIDVFLNILGYCSDMEQVQEMIRNYKRLQLEYDTREEGEIIIVIPDGAGYYRFVEKTKDETMLYSNDSEQWTIGIINICE